MNGEERNVLSGNFPRFCPDISQTSGQRLPQCYVEAGKSEDCLAECILDLFCLGGSQPQRGKGGKRGR